MLEFIITFIIVAFILYGIKEVVDDLSESRHKKNTISVGELDDVQRVILKKKLDEKSDEKLEEKEAER